MSQFAIFLHGEKMPTFSVDASNWLEAWPAIMEEVKRRDKDHLRRYDSSDPRPDSTAPGTTINWKQITIFRMPDKR